MNQLIYGIKDFIGDEDGVTMVEYGLLAALISIVSIITITGLGVNLHAVYTTICNSLKTAGGGAGTC
jgi:pilus assembly protein Flp/PilA